MKEKSARGVIRSGTIIFKVFIVSNFVLLFGDSISVVILSLPFPNVFIYGAEFTYHVFHHLPNFSLPFHPFTKNILLYVTPVPRAQSKK